MLWGSMTTQEITTPSGLRGRIRGLRGSEIDAFANEDNASLRDITHLILSATWVETLDEGPYDFGGEAIDWNQVLLGDQTYIVIYSRIATHGARYTFPFQCGVKRCRKVFDWSLDLTDLPVRPYSEEALDKFISDEPYRLEIDLDDGTYRIEHKLLTGSVHDAAIQAQNQAHDRKATITLARRTHKIYGPDGEPVSSQAYQEFYAGMGAGVLYDLLGAMDEVEGGLNTEIDLHCPHCKEKYEGIDLPVKKGFWSPRTKTGRPNSRVRRI